MRALRGRELLLQPTALASRGFTSDSTHCHSTITVYLMGLTVLLPQGMITQVSTVNLPLS